MIISLSGRLRSGKGEMASICEKNGFKRLYFAIPLKQLCAKLLNISIDELNNLKNNCKPIDIICSKESNDQKMMDDVEMLLHKANIHTSTVQIEIVHDGPVKDVCNDIVCNDKNCIAHHCCAVRRIEKELSQSN